MSRFLFCVFLLPILALAPLASRASDEIDPRLAGLPTLTFQLNADKIVAPSQIPAGLTVVIEEHPAPDAGHAFILRIPDDVADETIAAAVAASTDVDDEAPEWFDRGEFFGNGDRATADRAAVGVVMLTPGRYFIADPFRLPSEWAIVKVVGEVATPAALAPIEPDATVSLFEMDFTLPADLTAGSQLWEVTNTGALPHEMVLVPVPAGATNDDVVEAVIAIGDASFGFTEKTAAMEAAVAAIGPGWEGWTLDLIGGVGVISTRHQMWAQMDLAPGTYAALCFFPDDNFVPHFALGMTRVFTVR